MAEARARREKRGLADCLSDEASLPWKGRCDLLLAVAEEFGRKEKDRGNNLYL
jgi:hypothetical protein